MQTPPCTSRRGLSLIELLVVIAIIAVLVAILIPAVSSVRASADAGRCAANMRQIGIQLIAYASDNDGITVIPWDEDKRSTWQRLIAEYGGTVPSQNGGLGIWRCPANRVQSDALGAGHGEEHCSYGINGWSAVSDHGTRYTGARVASFTNPSKLYMLMDCAYYRVDASSNTGTGTIPSGLYSSGPNNLRYPHRGRINVVFADGHMEALEAPLENRGTVVGTGTNAERFSNGVHWFSH